VERIHFPSLPLKGRGRRAHPLAPERKNTITVFYPICRKKRGEKERKKVPLLFHRRKGKGGELRSVLSIFPSRGGKKKKGGSDLLLLPRVEPGGGKK